jgi:hypothetical protein
MLVTCLVWGSAQATSVPVLKSEAAPGMVTLVGHGGGHGGGGGFGHGGGGGFAVSRGGGGGGWSHGGGGGRSHGGGGGLAFRSAPGSI